MKIICPYCQNDSVSILRDGKSTRKCNRCFESWTSHLSYQLGSQSIGEVTVKEYPDLLKEKEKLTEEIFSSIMEQIDRFRKEIVDNNPTYPNMSGTREAVLMAIDRIRNHVSTIWTAYEKKPEAHNL